MASPLVLGLKLAITPLLKTLSKREIAQNLLDTGQATYKNILKPNGRYQNTFDDAFKLAGGKKISQSESGKIAAAAKKKLYEANPKLADDEYSKISKKFIDDIKSGKRTTPRMDQVKTATGTRQKADSALALQVKNKLNASEPEQKGVLSLLRAMLQKRIYNSKNPNIKRDEVSKLTQIPSMNRQLNQLRKEGYIPQLDEVGEVITDMRTQGGPEDLILQRIAEKRGNAADFRQKGTWGHEAGLANNFENLKLPNNFTDEIAERYKETAMEMLSKPQLMKYKPEQGLINKGKDPLDALASKMIRSGEATPKGLSQFSKLYDLSGITSLMPGLKGNAMRLGRDLNFDASRIKQIDFMNKSIDADLKPFWLDLTEHMRGYGNANRLPSFTEGTTSKMGLKRKDLFEKVLRGELTLEELGFNKGGKVDGYAAGGIGRIGIKLLAKLAKKLSPKEMKMLTGSAFKGTNPSKSLAKKREANLMKKLDGNYNWRNVKSKVPGPRSSVDRMNDKQYPYLDPDNDAFIVSGQSEHPVTGTPQLNKFGRYQLKSTINDTLGSDDSLFRKYSVYDWWDDITETIRERPKFKYVKDSKGNIIMKEVK